jgi:adenine-specific DNA-methyltransferase
MQSERELAGVALALGAREVAGWSRREEALAHRALPADEADVAAARRAIARGADPLGDAFCRLRSPAERRGMGATYTPAAIVEAMIAWAARESKPARVVDPGVGSGRFLVAAGRRFARPELVGVEADPLAALLARAHLATAGHAPRARIVLGDYRSAKLPPAAGATLFVGNPPYVRHHLVAPAWKRWLSRAAAHLGVRASRLAGLHVHFFLQTALRARAGDAGCFVTAAEWLDVNYGAALRSVLLDVLGVTAIHLVEPSSMPFADADATAAISCFSVGERPSAVAIRRVSRAEDLGALEGGRLVAREALACASRWTPLSRPRRARPRGWVELGELCRVHRGQVTGANRVWIAGPHARGLPEAVLFCAITRAREIIESSATLSDASRLRRVIDLPADLDALSPRDRRLVEAFLRRARAMGADRGFVATHREPWWSVRLREPAPILATYMARRPPSFVCNRVGARHINVAHGLYPREPMGERLIVALVEHLRTNVSLSDGRTYAGGLTKFEPREMERLLVPGPDLLASAA